MSDIENLLEDVACDLCARRNEEFLYAKTGVLTGYPFRVVRCRSCGLIYLTPRFREGAITQLYDRSYYDGQGFDSHVSYLADYDETSDSDKLFTPERTVRHVREIVTPPAELLDFGCGLGDLMRQASSYAFHVEGFEVSRFSSEFARANGFHVYECLEQVPSERYDVVTAIEVLEHCASPMKALAAIHRCLKPGGILYYTTANFDGFYENWRKGVADPLDSYILPEGHIYFFSTKVIRSYFREVGFRKVFYFEPSEYQRDGRLYRLLSRGNLVGTGDAPGTLLERLVYYGGRNVATALGLRERRPLPLARK